MYWITSSRRSCSKSTSMSGGSSRASETKRSNTMVPTSGDIEVMPSAQQTIEFAADPRPWQRMPWLRA